MTRLFKLAAGMGLPSSRYARLGQAHTGDLQKRRYTNGASSVVSSSSKVSLPSGQWTFISTGSDFQGRPVALSQEDSPGTATRLTQVGSIPQRMTGLPSGTEGGRGVRKPSLDPLCRPCAVSLAIGKVHSAEATKACKLNCGMRTPCS